MAAYAFIIMPNKLANDSGILPCTHSLSPPTPFQLPNALNLRFEQSSEQVQRRCLTNMSYQHLWHFYEAPTPTATHTLGCDGLAAKGAGIKLSQTVKTIQVQNRATILAQLNGESAYCMLKRGGGRWVAQCNNSSCPFVGVLQSGRCRAVINLMAQHVSPLEQQVTFQFNLSYLPSCLPPSLPPGRVLVSLKANLTIL